MAKVIDLGQKRGSMEVKTADKNKIYYPSFTVEKDLSVKMGQPVVCEGVVSGIRRDKYGNSVSVEVRKMSVKGKMSVKDFEKLSDKGRDDFIEGQKK